MKRMFRDWTLDFDSNFCHKFVPFFFHPGQTLLWTPSAVFCRIQVANQVSIDRRKHGLCRWECDWRYSIDKNLPFKQKAGHCRKTHLTQPKLPKSTKTTKVFPYQHTWSSCNDAFSCAAAVTPQCKNHGNRWFPHWNHVGIVVFVITSGLFFRMLGASKCCSNDVQFIHRKCC